MLFYVQYGRTRFSYGGKGPSARLEGHLLLAGRLSMPYRCSTMSPWIRWTRSLGLLGPLYPQMGSSIPRVDKSEGGLFLLEQRLREQIAGILSARPEVRKALLFGSRARGDAGDRSDIDLAIEAPTASRRQWLELRNEMEELKTLLRVDVVNLEEVGSGLKSRIAEQGMVVYEREEGGAKTGESGSGDCAFGRGASGTGKQPPGDGRNHPEI